MNYFAYGSNLHPIRLQQRTPSCRALGTARLSGYALRFHKRGRDGSGKGNAFYTGHSEDEVWGVVYSLTPENKISLDRVEGLGCGYNTATQSLILSTGIVNEVFFYMADLDYIDHSLRPYTWYKDLVVWGARAHQLPEAYIKRLEEVPAIDDPDAARHETHRRILFTIAP